MNSLVIRKRDSRLPRPDPSGFSVSETGPQYTSFDFIYTFNEVPQTLPEAIKFYDDLRDRLATLISDGTGGLAYAVGQLERGGESGRYHVHVFTQFADRCKGGRFRTLLAGRFRTLNPHIDVRRGSPLQAADYVKKADTRVAGPFEFGTIQADRQSQGKRTDLAEVAHALEKGATTRAIVRKYLPTFIKYHSGIERAAAYLADPESLDDPPEVFILWGTAGVGKTRTVRQLTKGDLFDVRLPDRVGSDLLRFDFFDGQANVLLDEYVGQTGIDGIKKLCDHYPFKARTFGGEIAIRPKRIWFTSQHNPQTWWAGAYPHGEKVQHPDGTVTFLGGTPDGNAFWRRVTASVCVKTAEDMVRFKREYEAHHGSGDTDPSAIYVPDTPQPETGYVLEATAETDSSSTSDAFGVGIDLSPLLTAEEFADYMNQ